MGIAGGAIIPYIYGSLAEVYGGNLQKPFWIMIPCYLFILFFATKGHKIGYKEPEKKIADNF
jgi:fucose permease